MTNEEIKRLVDEVKEEVIAWRRHLHANPELSFHEEKTAQFVYDTLQSFGNLELSRPTKTSVMARLIGHQPGRVVAIRADMDALPIQEENTFEFASKNPGVMHACGHDGHTAMLLGTAKILSKLRDQIQGEVRFLFQHAEELHPGGAEEMVQAGVMDGVDVVIGTHLWSPLERGKIGIVYGPMMAAPDRFFIRIHGKGGHAAMPHQTIDAIAIGAQVVTNLQYIVSRNVDPLEPLVVSVTQFVAGTTHNVIPGSVEIQGTVRSFDETLRKNVPKLMERIIKGITEAHGATYEFEFEYGYRPVINNDEVTRVMEETVREVLGEEAVDHMKPNMGGEDFSAFLQKAPGSFFYVGAGNKEKGIIYPHHHPRFTIDEDALEIGVRLFVHAAFKLLAEAP
ncbi:M20 family metallopeptidase [Saccharococcus caldoxylosilyticus]|jgi:amidohydrolase|uniref:N-acyl-L-amino acid amidohydrolase n=1 Tax=Parageobacillus caldoxylosilyticus NBRC 107762 TaxID=1220594 RepID=A0A023DDH7_9BACL|nr:M20 family metallopeptidase [Parageobacillus caldoxylosilyticus]OQP03442.1 N-acyl-L-amino acid amidohydrolase [Geobacillus sp. 44B]MBB3852639.1 amidohydrolase [Parageobacillus caldoxylosilyticus]QNU39504.1 amidohydrolase [Geobacillus sp. 44B]QXJ38681.1 N-acyl-L-amino acid amidohydrolase [Parageobacillus caldoxylosilyticus]GAJ39359.1 N-acyl-L-amino acid amidohydrolase [Parageobacillus caldoxylosilyticus NBRC 107762]